MTRIDKIIITNVQARGKVISIIVVVVVVVVVVHTKSPNLEI